MSILDAPTVLRETLGTKLRRLAKSAYIRDPWVKRPMVTATPWQPSTTYIIGNVVVNGGNNYVCLVSGTSAASGGPTGTSSNTLKTDNTASWTYFGNNLATSDPVTSTPAWAATTAYVAGNLVVAGSLLYACVAAGTSGSSVPTGTSNSVTDGTVTWTYMGVVNVNPYAADFPTVTVTTVSPLGTLSNTFSPYKWGGPQSAINAWVRVIGSGYVVGEQITISGGTSTVATVLQVTSVDGNGGLTGVSIATPGTYTIPPSYYQTQGSTTGSGTGGTFIIAYTVAPWYRVTSGFVLPLSSPQFFVQLAGFLSSTNPGAFSSNTASMELISDAPKIAFNFTTSTGRMPQLFIDDALYSYDLLPAGGGASSWAIVDFTTTGGAKTRKYRLVGNAVNISMGPISVAPAYNIWAPTNEDDVVACFVGDSVEAGSGYGPFVGGNTLVGRICSMLGWSKPYGLVVGGTGYLTPNSFGSRIPAGLLANPDIWVIIGSVNDALSNASSTFTPGSPTSVFTGHPHGLNTGDFVTWTGITGTGASLLNGISLQVTVTDTQTFTMAVNTTALTLTNGTGTFINTATGNAPLTDGVTALMNQIRAGGSNAPIVIVAPISDNLSGVATGAVEVLVKAGYTNFTKGNAYYVPVSYDSIPWIIGSYNNNPTPSGNTFSSASNTNTYIAPGGTHPIDFGTQYLAYRHVQGLLTNALNLIK